MSGGFGGVRLWVIDKGLDSGGFYDGGSVSGLVFDPYAGGGVEVTTQPAHVHGDAPSSVGTFLVSYSGLTNGATEAVQVVRLDDPLGSPSFTQSFVDFGDVEDFAGGALPNAPQSGTSTTIETNDRRALHSVWYDDSLWLTATIDPKSGDPDSGVESGRWETSYGKLCLAGACPPDMLLAGIDLSGTQTRKAAVTLRTVEAEAGDRVRALGELVEGRSPGLTHALRLRDGQS